MKVDIVTIFPRMVEEFLADGVLGRAVERGVIDARVHDLRDHTDDRHRVVDDAPYGGGPGMVMKPEPFFRAVAAITETRGQPDIVVLTSPQGRRFSQAEARRLSRCGHVVVMCGRYEGVDERVCEGLGCLELSIGDYVLSGGEPAALVIVDAVARLVPGVVGDEGSVEADSFARGLLDFPHYTRPAEFGALAVPPVLLTGHHREIQAWRKRQAVARTLARRPDLLAEASLDAEERAILEELLEQRKKGVPHGPDRRH